MRCPSFVERVVPEFISYTEHMITCSQQSHGEEYQSHSRVTRYVSVCV
jgi:hypothetical protein